MIYNLNGIFSIIVAGTFPRELQIEHFALIFGLSVASRMVKLLIDTFYGIVFFYVFISFAKMKLKIL